MLTPRIGLVLILLLYGVTASVGIAWGLPTARNDKYLFGGDPPWSGEKIERLARAGERESISRGADVDVDPAQANSAGPIDLTATEADVAAIYLRFRLYSHQPDEMITLMALAGMKPRELKLDPRLYQYGGLFIYPVGAAIGLCGALGLIEVTSDLTYYLDRPDEFGKFYVVARAYVALWGALGAIIVYAVATRLTSALSASLRLIPSRGYARRDDPRWGGVLAALFFTLMPITVCMSHEAKPHLPGAVLMLAAVWFGMRYTANSEFRIQNSRKGRHDRLLMCIACGAAFGMVLAALPVFVLVPLAEWMRRGEGPRGTAEGEMGRGGEGETRRQGDGDTDSHFSAASASLRSLLRVLGGFGTALAVYLVTNPYVAINALTNREVLASNLRNSTAMYEVGRIAEGTGRALALILEGASPILLVLGAASVAMLLWRCRRPSLPLLVPAGLLLVQFALLGAGKPAEYGRFGVFIDMVLAVATACFVAAGMERIPRMLQALPLAGLIAGAGLPGWHYLRNFRLDARPGHTREDAAAMLADEASNLTATYCLSADPAPYNCPPMNFARVRLLRYDSLEAYRADPRGTLIVPLDEPADELFAPGDWVVRVAGPAPPWSPISWANKPIVIAQPIP